MRCGLCSKIAVRYNAQEIPVCGEHSNARITPPSCPECHGTMLLRASRYGPFWSCSIFPQCVGSSPLGGRKADATMAFKTKG